MLECDAAKQIQARRQDNVTGGGGISKFWVSKHEKFIFMKSRVRTKWNRCSTRSSTKYGHGITTKNKVFISKNTRSFTNSGHHRKRRASFYGSVVKTKKKRSSSHNKCEISWILGWSHKNQRFFCNIYEKTVFCHNSGVITSISGVSGLELHSSSIESVNSSGHIPRLGGTSSDLGGTTSKCPPWRRAWANQISLR